MGCGVSTAGDKQVKADKKAEEKLRLQFNFSIEQVGAISLVQRWFRRKLSELQLRRKCCWQVFTDIEYKSEQEHLGISNFFSDLEVLKEALTDKRRQQSNKRTETLRRAGRLDEEAMKITTMYQESHGEHAISSRTEDKLFDRPNAPTHLSLQKLKNLIKGCQDGHIINFKLALSILDEAFVRQKTYPNIRSADTQHSHRITLVGDLHGKLLDLLTIFEKNGLPSDTNPYIINGDFVDRGKQGTEISLIMLSFQLLYPHSVYITRGNHEDYLMNKRYGFEQEVVSKYQKKASVLLRAFAAVFSALPLGVIINNKVLCIHGGLSEGMDLSVLTKINRQNYVSILRAAKSGQVPGHTREETKMVVNAMWSDPGKSYGSTFNATRGGGCVWGPNVTDAFLAKYDLTLIVRSHECMEKGFGWAHNKKVLTIFSASDYYAPGSNMGAYVRFDAATTPHIVQFSSAKLFDKGNSSVTLRQQVSVVERAAIKDIVSKIYEHKLDFEAEFMVLDPDDTGFVNAADWAETMTRVTELKLPWLTLKRSFVKVAEDGSIDYRSCLDSIHLNENTSGIIEDDDSQVAQALYQHLGTLEYIFRLIDVDASGSISKAEFCMACKTLNKYVGHSEIEDSEAESIADAIDLDKDGRINFNEFTESFRLVREKQRTDSQVSFVSIAELDVPAK